MDRKGLLLAATVILIAALLAYRLSRDAPGGGTGSKTAQVESRRGTAGTHTAEVSTPRMDEGPREPVPETPCRVLVLASDGAPVSQAEIRPAEEGSRWSPDGRTSVLGRSRADGLVTLDPVLCTEGARIEIFHPLFVRAFEDLSRTEPEPHRVTLEPAATQEFRAVWTTGEPVGECSFWLSRVCLPKKFESAHPVRGRPAGPAERAIHGASVDGQGLAVVRGLQPGEHGFVTAPSYLAPIAYRSERGDSLPRARLTVPGPPVTVVFAPLVVFAVEPDCDEQVAHRFLLGSDWELGGDAAGRLESTREALEATYPGAALLVAVPRVTIHEARRPTVEVLLRQKGRVRFECEAVQLEHFLGPQRLDCSGLPDEPLLESELHVFDAGGNRLDRKDFILVEGDSLFDSFWHFADARGKVYLPPGEYRAYPTLPWLQGTFPPTRGSPPMRLEVHLKVEVSRCVLEYELPWGELADRVRWKVMTPIGEAAIAEFVQDGPSHAKPLPVGRLRVRAAVLGRPPVETEIEVPRGLAGGIHAVRVRG